MGSRAVFWLYIFYYTPKVMILVHWKQGCLLVVHILLYTKSHDFATLEAGLSFGCDSDVVWCFASCIDFVHILLYTKLHLNCNQTHTLSSPKCTLLNHNQKTALLPM